MNKKIEWFINRSKLLKRAGGLARHKEFHLIIEETAFLPTEVTVLQRLWHIEHAVQTIPHCKMCNNEVTWHTTKKKYNTYCGAKCSRQDPVVMNKWKTTNIKKYGVENPQQNKQVQEKTKQTNLDRRGVEYPGACPNVREKQKQTNLKRYGVISTALAPKVKEKQKKTNLERYGHENPFGNKEVQDNIKQTNLKKYGYENPQQNKQVREKTKQTNLERYGVEYAQQNKEIKEKIKQTNLRRYGCENPQQNKEIKEKTKCTNVERYGAEYTFNSKYIQNKIKQTMLKRYNVRYPQQIKEIKEKTKCTNVERYGSYYPAQKHISKPTLDNLNNKDWLFTQHYTMKKSLLLIAEELNIGDTTIGRYLRKHELETQYYSKGIYNELFFENNPKNKLKDSFFYIIHAHNETESFIKIGITISPVEKRFCNLPYLYVILQHLQLPLYSSYLLEQHILDTFESLSIEPKIYFGGKTECFIEESYEDIIQCIGDVLS